MNCCICQFSVRAPKNIHTETVGNPPVLISDLVLQCTKGTDYVLAKESSSMICKKCSEKLARYHKSIQIARKLRQEILELIHSPYLAKDLNHSPLKDDAVKVERIAKFDGNIEEAVDFEEQEFEEEEEEKEGGEDMDSATETELVHQATIEEVVGEDEEHTFVLNEADEEGEDEQFQSMDLELDIDNEIIINEEATATQEEVVPQTKHEAEDAEFFKEDTMSEFEDHLDGTIEYIISDAEDHEQDLDSSGDYIVNIQCPSCPEKFSSRRAYNAHTKREHFPGYVCDQCGKTLQSYSGFIGHLQNHEPVKQFACPVCPERFSRKFRLKHHMAWHTGETPYQCEVCSKRFVHKVALYKHKMIHDNETKRLECQVCGFKTRTKAHLERHTRSHTGDKPFACPVCNKRFSQMYNMKAHLREHESPGTNRHRRYHCTKCTHTFINEQNYISHVQRDDCTAV